MEDTDFIATRARFSLTSPPCSAECRVSRAQVTACSYAGCKRAGPPMQLPRRRASARAQPSVELASLSKPQLSPPRLLATHFSHSCFLLSQYPSRRTEQTMSDAERTSSSAEEEEEDDDGVDISAERRTGKGRQAAGDDSSEEEEDDEEEVSRIPHDVNEPSALVASARLLTGRHSRRTKSSASARLSSAALQARRPLQDCTR